MASDLKIVNGLLVDGSGSPPRPAGYRATRVRGQIITEDGQRTAALPGRLLRVGQG
jgi:N-acyl-D-aspartate/D-glutamate deacylase